MNRIDDLLEFYRARVQSYPRAPHGYREQWSSLCKQLLTIGGDLVVPPMEPEQDLGALLSGSVHAFPAKPVRGRPRSCHENAASQWVNGVAHGIGTGYALSDDGLWRQHSWALGTRRGAPVILETTTPRVAYFGLALSGVSALGFATANAAGAVQAATSGPPTGKAANVWAALLAAAPSEQSGNLE